MNTTPGFLEWLRGVIADGNERAFYKTGVWQRTRRDVLAKAREGSAATDDGFQNLNGFDVAAAKRTKLYIGIRKDLLDQLERNGTIGQYYADLLDDYMDLWYTKQALVADIQARGVQVVSVSASGILSAKGQKAQR